MDNDSSSEKTKSIVLNFYEAALNEKNLDKAAAYLGDTYIQHNPYVADGPEGFKQFIQFLKETYPLSHNEVKRAFVDGNYVILHVHSVRVPGTLGRAIVEIFRVDNYKVVEHWDVIQSIDAPLYPSTLQLTATVFSDRHHTWKSPVTVETAVHRIFGGPDVESQ